MYFMQPTFQLKNTIADHSNMYYMSPTCNFETNSFDINSLLIRQEDVIVKLRVLKHNVNIIANNAGINCESDEMNKFLKIQDNVLSRLQSISATIMQIARESNIDIYSESTQQELENRQNNVNTRIENLTTQIRVLAGSIDLQTPQRVANISIFADCRNPPLSVILLLKLLKNRGYNVACMSYRKNREESKIQQTFSKYLNTNLNIDQPRKSYDIVVSIIWKDIDINECIGYNDVYNDSPLIGEVVILQYLCALLNIDIKSVKDKIESVNDDLLYQHNTKAAINLTNKLVNDIHIKEEKNLVLSAFVISCVLHSGLYEKIGKSVKTNIDDVLMECGADVSGLIDVML